MVKFGEHLKRSLIREYSYYYISYDDLKAELEDSLESNNGVWSEELETQFLESLEVELDKVYTFCKVKHNEVLRRVKEAQEQVSVAFHSLDSNTPVTDLDFQILEEELSDIIADVHDLAKFSRLNYTGFQKIIKKHDKNTKFILKPVFQVRMNAKPFFKENYDELVVKISQLYDIVRTRGNPVKGDSAAGGKQQNFVRQTTKYWVHPDNITELKLIILKHLPVLVFNTNKEFEKEDSAITSIYYDNEDLDLYYGRLRKDEGAEAHRLRWYGGMGSDTIFVERKTHREDWTGEKSVKARFALKEKYVNDFLHGKYTVEQAFAKMRREGKKSIQEIESLEALATEIQYTMLKKKLRPVVRSFYNRTAFQLPGDARVRISLDTELTMVREDNFDGNDRTNGNWRRMDIGVDWPFNQLPEKDVCRFPYAVLEVKLQTQLGQEPPEWVRELVGSHLVEPVPKFSKFIHGVATLLNDKVNLIPFWLPQMDVDIRKPAIPTNINITRPGREDDEEFEDTEDEELAAPANSYDIEEAAGDVPVNRGAGQPTGVSSAPNYGAITENANVPSNSSENAAEILRKIRQASNPVTKYWYTLVYHIDHYLYGDQISKVPQGTVFDSYVSAPPGKTICVPVRVEPKVYFATERTLLSWVSVGLVLGGVSTSFLTYGTPTTMVASIGFFITALVTIWLSTYTYCKRVVNIRMKRPIDYEDKYGPPMICAFLMASILFTFFCNIV
ncbi:vacuolar transporter chaperone 4 [Kluyveromyces marxianus DMKU3-1042]|uniref:Vacuolar transporter chaperone complex subunit 4 n=1 Tax=Kluyveromyces marxianus (strain DMKU3-1042 / BCC 29191 / NBRC 104275) TaxID=1003335 RepID=W0TDZ7_KLUMD|nr:vacuolar transporter chaperone 4 [Kluyveromyces marxianus DMKU3-1042]BAO40309.1 vacuolar transporter chaperone 4 [Kluyveromyces marxianus DMKU3-1042]